MIKVKSNKQAETITITLPESDAKLLAITMMEKAFLLADKHRRLGQNGIAEVWNEMYKEYHDLSSFIANYKA